MINQEKYFQIKQSLPNNTSLIAVSKTKTVSEIKSLYDLGQRDFGENYVQELVEKQQQLPSDIRWHFIGHLQTNKVKYIAPFITMVQSIDTFKLLKEVNKQALRANRIIHILLQVHIAKEETKFGLDETELNMFFENNNEVNELKNIMIKGMMGMASFTEDLSVVRTEFRYLKKLFEKYRNIKAENVSISTLSMGMSSDYTTAVEEGSNMVRIGSLIFGERTSV